MVTESANAYFIASKIQQCVIKLGRISAAKRVGGTLYWIANVSTV